MISEFRGEFSFLDNAYAVSIPYRGFLFSSVAHAFEANKVSRSADRELIQNASTPAEVKRIGCEIQTRPDLEFVREEIMLDLLRLKFQDEELGLELLGTEEHALVNNNFEGETFWGISYGRGANTLGKLLMRVRSELQVKMRS